MNWPHAPTHWLFEPGIYMVTVGTYEKVRHLNSPARLDFFLESLFSHATEFGWSLQAWAVLSNHYHFIAESPPDPANLSKYLGKLHMQTAKELNRQDATPGRKVWYQYRESRITFEKSYLARLHYVNSNPARHGVVPLAENYKWCSAAWFARNASPAFVATVKSFKTDLLDIPDDFYPACDFFVFKEVFRRDMSRRPKARSCPRTPKALRAALLWSAVTCHRFPTARHVSQCKTQSGPRGPKFKRLSSSKKLRDAGLLIHVGRDCWRQAGPAP